MKLIFIFINIFILLNCKILNEEEEEITIKPNSLRNFVGKEKGVIAFQTLFYDSKKIFNTEDIKEKTKFD